MKISIAIPTYEAHGRGVEFLQFQFEKFINQTMQDFEIIVSDHSQDSNIEYLCQIYSNKLNIKYIKNTINIGSSSSNINNAIMHCSGEIIKIIFQDDFLLDNYALEKIYNNFSFDYQWLISSCVHTKDDGQSFYFRIDPQYHDKIHLGYNTISSPSVLSIRNSYNKIYFDTRLLWLMDVDYYKSLSINFGQPKILNEITVVNRIWKDQLTNSISQQIKNYELGLVINKYGS
jgi:glycosyltransferase involved in cell wall biosynthesis